MIMQDTIECPFCGEESYEYDEDIDRCFYNGVCPKCGYYEKHGVDDSLVERKRKRK